LIVISLYYKVPAFTVPESYGAYILEAVQMFVPGMILLAWESYDDAQREEQRLYILEKERISTELNYIKYKVNPQFIFNTLKNLKKFVDKKSDKTPDMILRLSEVLDYVLYRSQQSKVNLSEEVAVINDFLALEKLRLGDKLDVSIRTEGSLSFAIAPLTILSLI
jgi:two-component system LytT family sensor kinase